MPTAYWAGGNSIPLRRSEEQMAFGKWLVGGLIGGLIGAAIWVAIGYFAKAEVGYVAWGIGLLVGLGVRFAAASDDQDPSPAQGILAAVLALVTILGAKYVVVELLVNDAMATEMTALDVQFDENDMIVGYADEIVAAKSEAGEQLQWPEGKDVDVAEAESDYPPGIWPQAEEKWNALSEEEQKAKIEQESEALRALADALGDAFAGEATKEAFMDSFTPFDLLWFGLALYTAFSVGYGNEDD